MTKPAFVVDTNVGVVANDRRTRVSPDCVIACVDLLQDLTDGRCRLVLDDGREILNEYLANLESSGQPGPGDAFLKWALQNQVNPQRCERVAIHPVPSVGSYEEFPQDPDLDAFDRSDRKFVAVALTSPSKPEIANAVDSDWMHHREALERSGVRLRFLCPDDLKP